MMSIQTLNEDRISHKTGGLGTDFSLCWNILLGAFAWLTQTSLHSGLNSSATSSERPSLTTHLGPFWAHPSLFVLFIAS